MANLSEDVALQVALAARALPDTAVGDLLEGILALVGEPLTLAKLKKIRLGKLKQLDCLRDIDETHLRKALLRAPEYPHVHLNLGILYQTTNRPAQADGHFSFYLAKKPNAPQKAQIEKWLADYRSKLPRQEKDKAQTEK